MYVLDTNVVSELRRLKPHGAVVAWFNGLRNDQIHLAAATIGEIRSGIERTRDNDTVKAAEIEAWLEKVVHSYRVLPMDDQCFRTFARLMHRKSNDLILDAMIAATAQVHGLTVATRDLQDFRSFNVPIFNPFTQPRP